MVEHLHQRRKITRSGFSLIELLIALSIFSIIGLGLYAGFSAGIRTWQRISDIEAAGSSLDRLYARLGTELKNAVIYSAVKFVGEPDKVSFFTITSVKGATRLMQKSYWKEGDVLKCSTVDLVSGNATNEDILTGVANVSFEYAIGDTYTGYSWIGIYKPHIGLPNAVKCTLAFSGSAAASTIQKVFYIPAGGWEK